MQLVFVLVALSVDCLIVCLFVELIGELIGEQQCERCPLPAQAIQAQSFVFVEFT